MKHVLQRSGRRIPVSRDEALMCCQTGPMVAVLSPPGCLRHEVQLDEVDPPAAELLALRDDAELYQLAGQEDLVSGAAATLLRLLESQIVPEEVAPDKVKTQASQSVRELTIRVVDHATGDPLAGVGFLLHPVDQEGEARRARTDSRGRVAFSGQKAGPHRFGMGRKH